MLRANSLTSPSFAFLRSICRNRHPRSSQLCYRTVPPCVLSICAQMDIWCEKPAETEIIHRTCNSYSQASGVGTF